MEEAEKQKFMVYVQIRRKGAGRVSVRLTTTPACSIGAQRALATAIEPELAARLECGTYAIERTMRFGSILRSAPDATDPQAEEELIECLVAPMDEFLKYLITSVSNLPDEDMMLKIVREVYAVVYPLLVGDATISKVLCEGFCTVHLCSGPEGIRMQAHHAAEHGFSCTEEACFVCCNLPFVIARDDTRVHVYVGIISDRHPFRDLFLARLGETLALVQPRAEREVAQWTTDKCREEAARLQAGAEALDAFLGTPDAQDAQDATREATTLWRDQIGEA